MIMQETIVVKTSGRATIDITAEIASLVRDSGIRIGLCNLFIRHTSASLLLCENADPDVRSDLERFMSKLVPDGDSMFEHTAEGDDDMPAHIRSILTESSLTVPLKDNRLLLGTWQGIYLWEHRYHSHSRQVTVSLYGE